MQTEEWIQLLVQAWLKAHWIRMLEQAGEKKKRFMQATQWVQLLVRADGTLNTNVTQAGAKRMFFIHTVDWI